VLQNRIRVLSSIVSAIDQKHTVYYIIETTTPLLHMTAMKYFISSPEDMLYAVSLLIFLVRFVS